MYNKIDKLLIALFLICAIIVIVAPLAIIKYALNIIVFGLMQIAILGGFSQ